MMKKTIGIILSLFLVTLLFAQEQRVFEKLTKRNHKNVKIESITWKGIRIRYPEGNRDRARYITDKDLSAAEQKLLAEELKIWKQKMEKRNRRLNVKNQFKKNQEDELKDLVAKLPKMDRKAISKWFQDRIGTNPYRKDFQAKFFKNYEYAKNCRAAMKSCETRLLAIDKAEFDKMKEECLAVPVSKANGILKRKVGAAFNHPGFYDSLRTRFVWVPVKERKNFVAAMNKKLEEEKKCCFCKKEPSLTPGSYGKNCSALVCTKCKKNLVDDKDSKSKEKVCSDCKEGAEGENPF